jgi:hypothetical protein
VIFGLKRKQDRPEPVDTEDEALDIVGEDVGADSDAVPGTVDEEESEADELAAGAAAEIEAEEEALDAAEDAVEPGGSDDTDYRADGPFDITEVDLAGDSVARVDLGSLVVTPFEGLGLQLQVNEATRQVLALTAVWQNSGLEVALFAAPASGGLAAELQEDLVEEAEQAGGNARIDDGPFGAEVRRVLPQTGPNGQQLFHVSRIWFAEGPRWLLRASLLGEAALAEADDTKAAPFVEFFRNLVVRRGSKPMVPGELIALDLPQGSEG